ncbi:MAG: Gfo/Idh/MocA family oxidoreductase [Gemmatimonadetes bacterium]|nr:Gfo/Idh/MocA family oxidoreductase [Gemmatimonadota bacterium]
MVGGGPGAFIGEVHRMAARLDGEWVLVAGSFSSEAARSAEMGVELGLDPGRVYRSFEEMMSVESALPEERRIEVVSIVTPNHLHHAVAAAALRHGFHVVCDKPLTTTVEHAEELCRTAAETGRVFCVTHNYTGYPMVKEARARVRRGDLGELRKVVVEYSQGWLRTLLEAEGQKQAEWRGDPERAGVSSALGDIGSHAHNLVRYVTGLEVVRLLADLGTVVAGRRLEDDATVLLELEGGVRTVMVVSQIATGERNSLRLRVYGSEGGVDWCQEEPDRLRLLVPDGGEEMVYRGDSSLSGEAAAATRLPGGHPEGFIEAFANVYRGVAQAVRGEPRTLDFPTAEDGAFGVHFIHQAVSSSRTGDWMDMAYDPARTA